MNLKEALEDKLNQEELAYLRRSFEIIGDIAIIDIPEELEKKKKIIAEAVTQTNKHIKTVLRKTGELKGKYRLGEYEKLIGDKTETTHTESGCRYKIDPTKAYFSEKLGTEREIIMNQVKNGEKILCMFAGVGPYPVLIAKNKDVKIDSIEVNPKACEYFEENIILNKVPDKIKIHCSDVKLFDKTFPKSFYDRVIMPAPEQAKDYLDVALKHIKKGGIVNFYIFAGEKELKKLPSLIEEQCAELGKRIKILETRKCGDFAPGVFRIAVDFKVLD